MSLHSEWNKMSDNHANQKEEVKFWEKYLKMETEIYNEILNNKLGIITGKFSDLANKYGASHEYFIGFLDGISESLEEEINLEEINIDSEITLKIDWEKLFYNMVNVEASWLYTLPGWKEILPKDYMDKVIKDYRRSKIIVKEKKIGRNEPCPCGSGKKYKNCCGKSI